MSRPRAPEQVGEHSRVVYLPDPVGTWVGVEITQTRWWSQRLIEVTDPERADLRLALVRSSIPASAESPAWLIVRPSAADLTSTLSFADVEAAWHASPWHRGPGASPEAYLQAAMQAMCPPHPPCLITSRSRDLLFDYLEGRPGPLGRLAGESDESVNRLVRVYWATPEALADDVLRERIRDDGGRHLVQLTDFLEAAAVDSNLDGYASLAGEQHALIDRLTPIRYFTDAADHDRAAALTLQWRARYQEAYAEHYGAVLREACVVMSEIAEAADALGELESMNSTSRPVGQDAARRLRDAISTLMALPETPDPQMAVTGGVVLGQMPSSFATARLAAAAVLAAVKVQRQRIRSAGELLAR